MEPELWVERAPAPNPAAQPGNPFQMNNILQGLFNTMAFGPAVLVPVNPPAAPADSGSDEVDSDEEGSDEDASGLPTLV